MRFGDCRVASANVRLAAVSDLDRLGELRVPLDRFLLGGSELGGCRAVAGDPADGPDELGLGRAAEVYRLHVPVHILGHVKAAPDRGGAPGVPHDLVALLGRDLLVQLLAGRTPQVVECQGVQVPARVPQSFEGGLRLGVLVMGTRVAVHLAEDRAVVPLRLPVQGQSIFRRRDPERVDFAEAFDVVFKGAVGNREGEHP